MPVDDSNTKFLLHMNGADGSTAFVDEGGNSWSGSANSSVKALLHFNGANNSTTITDDSGRTWGVQGGAKISTTQSVFGGSSLFPDPANSGYAYTVASADFDLGSGDWSFQFRVRLDSRPTIATPISQFQDAGNYFRIYFDGVSIICDASDSSTVRWYFYCAFAPSFNTWYDIYVARSGNTPIICINGTSQSITQTTSISGKSLAHLNAWMTIGTNVYGYIDETRIGIGSAFYTGSYSVTSAEYNYSGIISTLQYEFGGSSAKCSGYGTYVVLNSTPPPLQLSNQNWTFDFWVRIDTKGSYDINLYQQFQDGSNYFFIWYRVGTDLIHCNMTNAGVGIWDVYATAGIVEDTWYHISVERNGNSALIFVNGVSKTVSENVTISGKTASSLNGIPVFYAHAIGWADEFRYSLGVARWTSNFTPPTASYPHAWAVAGAISSVVGSLIKMGKKNVLAGSISSIVGAISRGASKLVSGAISSVVGTISKRTSKFFTGAITSITGRMSYIWIAIIGGTLGLTGGLLTATHITIDKVKMLVGKTNLVKAMIGYLHKIGPSKRG